MLCTGTKAKPDLIIAGGGIAGCLLLVAVRHHFPEAKVELHEAREALAGNHTWCFHEADIPAGARVWLEPLISKSWPGYEVLFPRYQRHLPTAYHAIRSEDLRERLMSRYAEFIHLNSRIDPSSEPETLVIQSGGWPQNSDPVLQGYQKFVGLDVELSEPHGLAAPILKDVRVEQTDGYRFFYLLPWSEKSLLVEDTYYSNSSDLAVTSLDAGIRKYIQERGWKIKRVHRREVGCLPLPVDPPRKSDSPSMLSLGAASGIFNPVTGYTLPQTLACIQALAESRNLDREIWQKALKQVRQSYEGQFRYLRFLNRMMFLAAEPEKRYVILERFYRLSEGLIGRFYSARLRPWDRLRILVGKPPVPVRKALLLLKRY